MECMFNSGISIRRVLNLMGKTSSPAAKMTCLLNVGWFSNLSEDCRCQWGSRDQESLMVWEFKYKSINISNSQMSCCFQALHSQSRTFIKHWSWCNLICPAWVTPKPDQCHIQPEAFLWTKTGQVELCYDRRGKQQDCHTEGGVVKADWQPQMTVPHVKYCEGANMFLLKWSESRNWFTNY